MLKKHVKCSGVVKFFDFKNNFGFIHSPSLKKDIHFSKPAILEPFNLVFKNEMVDFIYDKVSNKAIKVNLSNEIIKDCNLNDTNKFEEEIAFQVKSLTKIGKSFGIENNAFVNQNNRNFYLDLSNNKFDFRINLNMKTAEFCVNFLISEMNLMCVYSETINDNIFNPDYIMKNLTDKINNDIASRFTINSIKLGDNLIKITIPIATYSKNPQ